MTSQQPYAVRIKRSAEKELDKLPKKLAAAIGAAILRLEREPRPHGSRRLRGSDSYRIRHGEYRILYFIDDQARVVQITAIGNRKDVYRGI